jgi:hypothetical protein
LTKCENFIKCLKDYKKIIDIINNSTKQNGDAYSVNTKKALYQMIIYLIDKLHLPISTKIKQQYIQQFEVYKINSNDETIQKQETTQIPSFSDYLQKIKNEYGLESKIYVLSKLYEEVTLRDDFILKIKKTIQKAEEDDDNSNYIVIPKKENLTLIVNRYKTFEKYKQIKVKLSLPLSKIILMFFEREKIPYDGYLFGDKLLSSFVSNMNRKVGITGGISLYRQMSVSDLLKTKPTAQARQKLAETMKHSPIVQLRYLRKNVS